MAAIVLVLAGCGSDRELVSRVPSWPDSAPPPLADTVQVDRVVQVTAPLADVLWVIDDSRSMADEQDALAANVGPFLAALLDAGLDWHVGAISTDVDEPATAGVLRPVGGERYLTLDAADPEVQFAELLRMGTAGSRQERGLGATWLALFDRRYTENAGFYRPDAALHTVVISDENDKTTELSLGEFTDGYAGLGTSRTFSSIVSYVADPWGAEPGTRYLAATDLIGGIGWDIDDGDWAAALDQLGLQAAGLGSEFFLSRLPVPETLVVRVEEGPVTLTDLSFAYDPVRNSVLLESTHAPLAVVVVEYEIGD